MGENHTTTLFAVPGRQDLRFDRSVFCLLRKSRIYRSRISTSSRVKPAPLGLRNCRAAAARAAPPRPIAGGPGQRPPILRPRALAHGRLIKVYLLFHTLLTVLPAAAAARP